MKSSNVDEEILRLTRMIKKEMKQYSKNELISIIIELNNALMLARAELTHLRGETDESPDLESSSATDA